MDGSTCDYHARDGTRPPTRRIRDQVRGGLFRSLYFSYPAEAQAEPVYQRYRASGIPTAAEYTVFQDFIFR